jgi:hypothetical protein
MSFCDPSILSGWLVHSEFHAREGEIDGRGTQLYIISIVMVVVTGFLVMARIAARLPKTRPSLGLDDYTIIVALVSQHGQFTEKYCRN